ncbi:MAG: prepilin-type N-terminal cleavage/methylation domain-containing protein [Bacteroidetes bacterium]|nr:prepilin-type N-terminal cleavage/methylation domain-containing protein [Bacteroidota bacterium]
MIRKINIKKIQAYSLTELLVVLVIIGILILLALPSLMPLISRAKSTEAKIQLEHIYTLEKTYFYMNSKYSTSFDELGFEQSKTTKNGGTANYIIEITEAGNNTFVAKATAINDFNGNGVINVWEINQEKELKEVVKD